MQRTKRLCGLGAAMLLGATVLLASSGAFAVSIPGDVYTLPPSDTVTVELGDPAPFPGTPEWIRLRPHNPSDPVVDYTAVVCDQCPGPGPGQAGTPSNAWVYDLTFTVMWNGNINGNLVTDPVAPQMLFAIVDSRFESEPGGNEWDTTYDLFWSGFVRGTFAVNGNTVTPQIVRDDPNLGGFVIDNYPDNWIGVNLPAIPGRTFNITMQWALGQVPTQCQGCDDVYFPNALFVATVPEPGTAVLLGVALVGMLGVARRARHRGA